jgi:hypothetical protein
MDVSISGTQAGTADGRWPFPFLERRPFEIFYAAGKGLVSSPEIARIRPNNAETQGLVTGIIPPAVNGRDLPRFAETGREA